MRSGQILSSREKRDISELLEKQWGIDVPKEMREQAWLLNAEDRLFLCTRDFGRLPYERLRIERAGIYIATMHRGELRLSVEGSQMLGPLAKKNIVELDAKEAHLWLQGGDIVKEVSTAEPRAFVLIRHKTDFLGCGKLSEGKILNFVPKERRLKASAEPFL